MFERDGSRFVPTQLARGPWNPKALHGGAPSALFATVCEMHDPGPAAFVARLTVELMRPVPLAPLELRVRTIRPGKKVQWIEAMLLADGDQEVARATALRIRADAVDTSGAVHPEVDAPPPPDRVDAQSFPFGEGAIGFWNVHDVRLVGGSWMEPGPGIAWFNLRCPVDRGRADLTDRTGRGRGRFRQRSVESVAADERGRDQPGVDRARAPPSGRASGYASSRSRGHKPHGVGMAETRLHDEDGVIGRGVQSLLVESAVDLPMRL